MNKIKRVYVYAEDAPVHSDVVAHGLHRAAPPILRSIIDHIDGIAIYPVASRYDASELDQKLSPLCHHLSLLPTLLSKIMRRSPGLDLGIADALPASLLSRAVRKSGADILFSFVGADVRTLARAAKLASLSGKACVFFIVDDFLAQSRLSGANENALLKAAETAQTALSGAKHVFTITDALGERLRESYGVAASTLRLAFEPAPRPQLPAKNQIVYVGSINFLYAEGLRDLLAAVRRVRLANGIDLKVRLTVAPQIAARELGDLPPFVVSAPVENSEGLAAEIASSMFAFLPYSFHPREKEMVSTSFPSKSMEYLAYARSIVVYGPEYGVAPRLFREKGLPSVVSSPADLEETTRRHQTDWPEHSVVYRKYLVEAHSLTAARRTICDSLGLESH